MSLLDDVRDSTSGVEKRRNALAESITSSDGRYSFHNADQQDSWNGRWLAGDNERLRQLKLLSDAVQSPEWTAKLDDAVTKNKDAGFKAADLGHRTGQDSIKTGTAASGTSAGSWNKVLSDQNDLEMAKAKATVTQQVSELKAAGIQNLDEMGRQLLASALAGPEESQAMGITSQGNVSGYNADQLATKNASEYRGLLANTLTNFVTNNVTPAITGGFQSADRWNQQMRNNYMDARDSGDYQGSFANWENANGGSRSWWGSDK